MNKTNQEISELADFIEDATKELKEIRKKLSETNQEEWEKEFRQIFKPELSKNGYQGSYMLNVPYEEMVHYFGKTLQTEKEKMKKELMEELTKIIPEELGFHDNTSDYYTCKEEVEEKINSLINKIQSI